MASLAMEGGPIEAKSLSSLNELADNPPSELTAAMRRNVKGNLTLYIARVPGSRDVFLTTMKPRAKVVTAQDVESSLYYCHLETAADEAIRRSLQSLDLEGRDEANEDEDLASHGLLQWRDSPEARRSPGLATSSPVPSPQPVTNHAEEPRPPLPDRGPSESTQSSQIDSHDPIQPHKIHRKPVGSVSPKRKPVGSVSPKRKPVEVSPSRKPLDVSASRKPVPMPDPALPRRPLGPRPLQQRAQSDEPRADAVAKENIHPYASPLQSPQPYNDHAQAAPKLPPRRNTQEQPSPTDFPIPVVTLRQNTTEYNPPSLARSAPPPLPLRPGPSSRTSSFEPERRDSSESSSSASSFVTASQFRVTIIRRDPVTGGQWNIGQITKESAEGGSKKGKTVDLAITSGAYDHFLPQAGESETSPASSRPRTEPFELPTFRRALNLRRGRKPSDAPFSPTRSAHGDPPRPHTAGGTTAAATAAPFAFTSPWHGQCEFVTGITGRSLRCRHVYPGGGGAGRSPDRSAASFEPALAAAAAASVSDLRFNLPLLKQRRHRDGASAPSKHRKPRSAHAATSTFADRWRGRHSRGTSYDGPSGGPSPRWGAGAAASPADGLGVPSSGPGSGGGHRLARSMDAGMGSPRERHGADDEEPDAWDDAVLDHDDLPPPLPLRNHPHQPPMDVSLALERAGGGFGGNKAKLGKLVVEGEGVLMLDLVVLANMGVWWALTSD